MQEIEPLAQALGESILSQIGSKAQCPMFLVDSEVGSRLSGLFSGSLLMALQGFRWLSGFGM